MVQWITGLPHNWKDLNLNPWKSREPGIIVSICNDRISTVRWESDTRKSLETLESASLAQTVEKKYKGRTGLQGSILIFTHIL
jgi:hypothetical protein